MLNRDRKNVAKRITGNDDNVLLMFYPHKKVMSELNTYNLGGGVVGGGGGGGGGGGFKRCSGVVRMCSEITSNQSKRNSDIFLCIV